MAITANKEGPKFILDSTWDAVTHIEGWYFRQLTIFLMQDWVFPH